MRSKLLLGAAVLLSSHVFAGVPQTVTLDVKNMTCELCPVTVKKALEKTPGVAKVQIDSGKKTAVVTYDPDVASVAVLVQSTTNAGYPSAARDVK